MDEKKRIAGSSGMKWEDEVVKLVNKISKEIKTSSEYKEKKKQMLDERREYIRREKIKRRSSTSNTGPILIKKIDKEKQSPKTAHKIVSFCDGNYVNENAFTNKASYKISCGSTDDKGSTHATTSSGTNIDDFASFISDNPPNISNITHSTMTTENQRIATKSYGTSTEDLPRFNLDTPNDCTKTTSCLNMDDNRK